MPEVYRPNLTESDPYMEHSEGPPSVQPLPWLLFPGHRGPRLALPKGTPARAPPKR